MSLPPDCHPGEPPRLDPGDSSGIYFLDGDKEIPALRAAAGMTLRGISEGTMRADIETAAAEIEQSIALLRRRL